jgi:hypothetical protein
MGKDPGAVSEPAQPGESAQPESTPVEPIAHSTAQSAAPHTVTPIATAVVDPIHLPPIQPPR